MVSTGSMADPKSALQEMYTSLAEWWPLLSPPEDYAGEAAYAATLLRSATGEVREVLELGSGGGSNAFHLTEHFAMTLTDLSPHMLEVSRRLNSQCEHVQGDMRSLRLGRTFDAVFAHDAVSYLTTEDDVLAAARTAYEHCRPGAVAVFLPDHFTETFQPSSETGGTDAPDGRGLRYVSWTFDPEPADTLVTTHYAFLLRESDGSVRSAYDVHEEGVFPRRTWMMALDSAGFETVALTESTDEDRTPRTAFVGRRPDV